MEATSLFDHFEDAVDRELSGLFGARGYGLERSDREREFMLFTSDRSFAAVGFVPGSDPSVRYVDLRVGPLAAAAEPSSGFDLRQILRHYEPGLSRPEVNQRVGRGLFRAPPRPRRRRPLSLGCASGSSVSPTCCAAIPLCSNRSTTSATPASKGVCASSASTTFEPVSNAAWLAGDWGGVAELLRGMPSAERSRSDAKRLEIAERRVRS